MKPYLTSRIKREKPVRCPSGYYHNINSLVEHLGLLSLETIGDALFVCARNNIHEVTLVQMTKESERGPYRGISLPKPE